MANLPSEVQQVVDLFISLWGSYPVLLIVAGLLIFGLVKKLMKLAVFAGICLLLWFFAFNSGVQLPI